MNTIQIDDIYLQLRQQIIDRSITPGTKLVGLDLSRKYYVSRTPIREALRRLESEELVTYHRSRGFTVSAITIEDIKELYTIRVSLEGLASKLATPIISSDPQKLKSLKRACREMEALCEKRDIEAYGIKNNGFHFQIWNSCGNRWLIKILENLNSQISRFIVKVLHVPNRMERSIREHWEIYKNLKQGDAKRVERIVGNHFKNALDDIEKELVR